MKRAFILLLCLVPMALCLGSCDGGRNSYLSRGDWAPDVKSAINEFISLNAFKDNAYVVFDFDNTSAIFDIEEQLIVYQLQTMSFALSPEGLREAISSGLGTGPGNYEDWLGDICDAYGLLYETYGPFTSKGIALKRLPEVHANPMWREFATKMGAMYDLIQEWETPDVAYNWVLTWFAGMKPEEVYDLAARSHKVYGGVDTDRVTWRSPIAEISRVGPVTYEWTRGVQVTENIRELWKALNDNGIDVWVCSASGIWQVLAAIDVFGLRDYCTGVMGMTVEVDGDGRQTPRYDYEHGYAFFPSGDGAWVTGKDSDRLPTCAQTAGPGKVTAIRNVLMPVYSGHGPIGGFMDSTGDFNFCTEFSSLQLVCCFNRANRKVTDGGGLVAEVAMYERDVLHYNLRRALKAGDVLYVLQGRDENGKRTFRPSNATLRFGETEEKLFAGERNFEQLKWFKDNGMTVADIFGQFSIRTGEDNPLGFAYGFLDSYDGYKSIECK